MRIFWQIFWMFTALETFFVISDGVRYKQSKGFYELQQAPRLWCKELRKILEDVGFQASVTLWNRLHTEKKQIRGCHFLSCSWPGVLKHWYRGYRNCKELSFLFFHVDRLGRAVFLFESFLQAFRQLDTLDAINIRNWIWSSYALVLAKSEPTLFVGGINSSFWEAFYHKAGHWEAKYYRYTLLIRSWRYLSINSHLTLFSVGSRGVLWIFISQCSGWLQNE